MTDSNKEYSAKNIADYLGGEVVGDPNIVVNGICKIDQGKKGGLSFLSNPKYEKYIYTTDASVVLVSMDFDPKKKVSATLIRVEDPYLSLSRLMDFYDQSKAGEGVSKNTFIHESATVGENVYVGEFTYVSENASIGNNVKLFPQVYVGRNVVIKDNSILYPGAKIYQDTVIGCDCIIHSGAVIGSDGYGFAKQPDKSYKKIPQLGNVILGDRVEIGANVTIDRAAMGSTIIHDGVKISNLVEIAHGCEVGENTLIIGMSGIAGSSKIGKNCILGGQVGIAGHISVADNVTIGGRAGVTNNIKEDGALVLGFPARNLTQEKRSIAVYGRLPELEKMVLELRKELDDLQGKSKKAKGKSK